MLVTWVTWVWWYLMKTHKKLRVHIEISHSVPWDILINNTMKINIYDIMAIFHVNYSWSHFLSTLLCPDLLVSYPLNGLFGCDTDVHVHLFKCPYPLLAVCSEVPHRTNHSCSACKYVQTRVLAGKLCFRYKTDFWHWGNLKRDKQNQYNNIFIIILVKYFFHQQWSNISMNAKNLFLNSAWNKMSVHWPYWDLWPSWT